LKIDPNELLQMKNPLIKISLFYCANSLNAEEISKCGEKLKDVRINEVSLPCSGKVNLLYLLKAIETGSDAVILATCKFGECKFLQGNIRAEKRVEAVDNLLEETGLGRNHIRFVQLDGISNVDKITAEICNLQIILNTELQMIQK
jgi:coenzyme F420-reducing hydrogenase delta subunit